MNRACATCRSKVELKIRTYFCKFDLTKFRSHLKVMVLVGFHCLTTSDCGCYFIPDKSYGRSVSDMKCVRSLIVPSLHIGVLP